jgi:hypothetical protein
MTSSVKRTKTSISASRQIRRRSPEPRRTGAAAPGRTRSLATVAEVNTVRLDSRFEIFLR